jgi:preprotein translocase subunit SecD
LGLDLRGVSHLLLAVDTGAIRKEMTQTLRDRMERLLRRAQIGYSDVIVRDDGVNVRILNATELQPALAKLSQLVQPLGELAGASGQVTVDDSTANPFGEPEAPRTLATELNRLPTPAACESRAKARPLADVALECTRKGNGAGDATACTQALNGLKDLYGIS